MSTEVWATGIAASAALLGSAAGSLITWRIAADAERRADAREERTAHREETARQKEFAEEVAEAFLKELKSVRSYYLREEVGGGPPLDVVFEDAWIERIELQLRQPIDRLSNDVTRRHLRMVLDAVGDYAVCRASAMGYAQYLMWLFNLGRELAMASVRGQEPDEVVGLDTEKLEGYVRIVAEQREDNQDSS